MMNRIARLAGAAGVIALVSALIVPAFAFAEANAPTFTKDVAPILNEQCVACHRDGEVAPMSLTSYQEVRPWARAIKNKVASREMPPWFADNNVGLAFANDPSLSQDEIDTIVAWVDGGSVKGDDADLPPAPTFAYGWGHPDGHDPDVIIPMSAEPFEIAAEGQLPWLNFTAKTNFDTDVFATAIEARAGNRAVIHHITITGVESAIPLPPGPVADVAGVGVPQVEGEAPEGAEERKAPRVDLMAVYVPGAGFEQYLPGHGKRVIGGPDAYLNFNMHYQMTGRPETDRSSMGVWLLKEPMTHEVLRDTGGRGTTLIEGAELLGDPRDRQIPAIPPHAAHYERVFIKPYPQGTTLFNFNPHAHLRGSDFEYTVVHPDGREQVVLSIPKYDFNWQLSYDLAEPLVVPPGSTIVTKAHWDNSVGNRYNPAPDEEVPWAEQSFNEMFSPHIMYTVEVDAKKDTTQDQ